MRPVILLVVPFCQVILDASFLFCLSQVVPRMALSLRRDSGTNRASYCTNHLLSCVLHFQNFNLHFALLSVFFGCYVNGISNFCGKLDRSIIYLDNVEQMMLPSMHLDLLSCTAMRTYLVYKKNTKQNKNILVPLSQQEEVCFISVECHPFQGLWIPKILFLPIGHL